MTEFSRSTWSINDDVLTVVTEDVGYLDERMVWMPKPGIRHCWLNGQLLAEEDAKAWLSRNAVEPT